MLQIGSNIRPTQGGKRPERRTEPCIQHIRVLLQLDTAARGAGSRIFPGDNHLSAGAVPGWNTVPPPKLPGNAPVTNIFHPVQVRAGKTLRNEARFSLRYRLNGRFCQRFHPDKPLPGNQRLNLCFASLAVSYSMGIVLDFFHQTQLFQVAYNLPARLVTIHPRVFSHFRGHCALFANSPDRLQTVSLADFKVIGIMSGSDLHSARTKRGVNIFIGDDGNFPVH